MSRARRLQSSSDLPTGVEQRIANLYTPDLSSCWGVECVQVASLAQPFSDLTIQVLAFQGTPPSCGGGGGGCKPGINQGHHGDHLLKSAHT